MTTDIAIAQSAKMLRKLQPSLILPLNPLPIPLTLHLTLRRLTPLRIHIQSLRRRLPRRLRHRRPPTRFRREEPTRIQSDLWMRSQASEFDDVFPNRAREDGFLVDLLTASLPFSLSLSGNGFVPAPAPPPPPPKPASIREDL